MDLNMRVHFKSVPEKLSVARAASFRELDFTKCHLIPLKCLFVHHHLLSIRMLFQVSSKDCVSMEVRFKKNAWKRSWKYRTAVCA